MGNGSKRDIIMKSRKIVSFDWAIKNILRNKANFNILEGFIYALLKEKISISELIESESNQNNTEMKFNRVDLLAVNEKGEHIIIEVQYAPEQSYFKRLLYGTSKDIVDNLKIGEDYSNVKKVYSVSLIYFDVEVHTKGKAPVDYVYHGRVDFTGLHNGKRVKIDTNYLIGYEESGKEDINIFPEYFIIPVTLFNDEVKDDLDQWIYAFKNNEVKDSFSAPGIKEMGEKLEFISMSPKEQRIYNRYLEDLASERGVFKFYERKEREAKAEGRIEGKIEGKLEGKLEGKIEGKLETAVELKKLGVSVSVIIEATGLTKDEIGEL